MHETSWRHGKIFLITVCPKTKKNEIHPIKYQFPVLKWYYHETWRHQMETLSALLAPCAGNSPVTGEFPSQRPVTRSFYDFFDLCLNKWLSKQSWGVWFEMLSCALWRRRNEWTRPLLWLLMPWVIASLCPGEIPYNELNTSGIPSLIRSHRFKETQVYT